MPNDVASEFASAVRMRGSNISANVNTFTPAPPVPPARFGFVHKAEPLSYVHICKGRGLDKGLQNGLCRVESNEKIVKAGFHSFPSILDQNTLLKASRTNRKYAQEFPSGKKWVFKC